ncbi:MAG: hypothetical protein QNJ44_21510 [Rhodobacter sp.]|nr:hypothetical protein [Rhodobacter sp.]
MTKFQSSTGRETELENFVERCEQVFEGDHISKLARGMPFGSPTTSIDVGTAILCNSSLSDDSRAEVEEILRRPVDNSVYIEEDAPGLRSATVPSDETVYSILPDGDPLHHASMDRGGIDPLDPLDAFFDVHGPEHQILAARVQETRKVLRDVARKSPGLSGKSPDRCEDDQGA